MSVNHTYNVLQNCSMLENQIKDAEIGINNYLQSDRINYLNPYSDVLIDLSSYITKLDSLTHNNREQNALITELKRNIAERIEQFDFAVDLRNKQGIDQSILYLKSARCKTAVANISNSIADIIHFENKSLEEQGKKIDKNFNLSSLLIFAAIFSIILIIVSIIVILRRKQIEREKTIKHYDDIIRKYLFDSGIIEEQISESDILKTLQQSLINAAHYLTKIGDGDYSYEFPGISLQNKKFNTTNLTGELIRIKNKLGTIAQNDLKLAKEEDERNWVTKGMAHFNEILRRTSGDVNNLSNEVVKNLVKYIEANQGGLFLLNDTNPNIPYLELVAAFAYNRKKHLKKHLQLGEGMVGMCALEKQTVYLTEIPNDYIKITSGLGGANPKSLLIVPLKAEEAVLGVIEIASFNLIQKYEIEFVEKLAESIGATLSIEKINARTAQLLQESQSQSEQLALKEAEMENSIKKIEGEKEQALEKAELLSSMLQQFDNVLIRLHIKLNGQIIEANRNFLKLFNYSDNQLKKMKIINLIPPEEINSFQHLWNFVIDGQTQTEIVNRQTITGEKIWLLNSYTPLYKDGKPESILMISSNITAIKENEQKCEKEIVELSKTKNRLQQEIGMLKIFQDENYYREKELANTISAMDSCLLKADFKKDGTLLNANTQFLDTLGYKYEQMVGKNIKSLIPSAEISEFEKNWSQVLSGAEYRYIASRQTTFNENLWLEISIIPIKTPTNEIKKILFLAHNITTLKENEYKFKNKIEELSIQLMEIQRKLEISEEEKKEIEVQIEQLSNENSQLLEINNQEINIFNQENEKLLSKKENEIQELKLKDKKEKEVIEKEVYNISMTNVSNNLINTNVYRKYFSWIQTLSKKA